MRDEVRAAEVEEEPPVQPFAGDHLLHVRDVWHNVASLCSYHRRASRTDEWSVESRSLRPRRWHGSTGTAPGVWASVKTSRRARHGEYRFRRVDAPSLIGLTRLAGFATISY